MNFGGALLRMLILALFGCLFQQGRIFAASGPDARSIALVDTSTLDRQTCKPLTNLLGSVGFRPVDYYPLDVIMDTTPSRLALSRYKAVFFMLSPEFLSGIGRSYVCAKFLQLIEQYAQLKGTLIGLVFPSLRAAPGTHIVGRCQALFQRLGIKIPSTCSVSDILSRSGNEDFQSDTQNLVDVFCYATNIFLSAPLESRPLHYQTTLHMPHDGFLFDEKLVSEVLHSFNQPLFLLPFSTHCMSQLTDSLPYGLYWFNPCRANHVFITTTTALTFSSITENFHICPLQFGLKHEMMRLVQRMLWEVKELSSQKEASDVIVQSTVLESLESPPLPSSMRQQAVILPEKTDKTLRTIAWMEINVFQDAQDSEREKNPLIDQQRLEQRQKLIDYIVQSKIDGLWVTFNPQLYYSPIGRLANKQAIADLWKSISRFTLELATHIAQAHVTMPRILVGYEIANNLYEPNLPQHCAVDVYENVYKDLPVPTSKKFWQTEIIDPLEVFVREWKKTENSHGVPLDGVVLDLEMYCRKKTNSFLETMTFDSETFSAFYRSANKKTSVGSLRDRALMLMKNNASRSYFSYLEHQAQAIGNMLQRRCSQLIRNCQFVCYLPHINISWFYKSLYKGLSSNRKPLYLLTFNSEFLEHEQWFKQQSIPVRHSSVLLLSKLKDETDFSWLNYMLSRHHSIWLNRFSRFVEPQAKDWTSVEQPAMPENLYVEFMKYLSEI